MLLPLFCYIQIYCYTVASFSVKYLVLCMYIFSGGAYKYMCYTEDWWWGAECAVRCVHMCSVGMGQENLYKDLQYIQLIYFKGIEVRKHEHRHRAR